MIWRKSSCCRRSLCCGTVWGTRMKQRGRSSAAWSSFMRPGERKRKLRSTGPLFHPRTNESSNRLPPAENEAFMKYLEKLGAFLSMSLLLLAFSRFSPAAQISCVWTGVEKIIAVGDLHGDYDNFILILKNPKVGLVDDNLHWIGGKTHYVQTGDIMDRGDKAKEILDFLMRLEKEAEAAGGQVHILLGNHEEATITGISLGYPGHICPMQSLSFLPEDFRKSKEKEYISRLPADEQAQVKALGEDLAEN